MEIANFKSIDKGILVASFDVFFPKWGQFTIHDCKFFRKDGKEWITFPGIPFEKEGKTMYKKVISFDNETYQKMQHTLKNLILDEIQKNRESKKSLSSELFYQNEDQLPF